MTKPTARRGGTPRVGRSPHTATQPAARCSAPAPCTGAARWLCAALLFCALLASAKPAGARPERIRPGHSYYSDSVEMRGGVSDLGQERNFEEVYQHYTYYEAVYDDRGRVVSFIVYERGDWMRREHYRYDEVARQITLETEYADGRRERRTMPLP